MIGAIYHLIPHYPHEKKKGVQAEEWKNLLHLRASRKRISITGDLKILQLS